MLKVNVLIKRLPRDNEYKEIDGYKSNHLTSLRCFALISSSLADSRRLPIRIASSSHGQMSAAKADTIKTAFPLIAAAALKKAIKPTHVAEATNR
jgi:hypothetical protein